MWLAAGKQPWVGAGTVSAAQKGDQRLMGGTAAGRVYPAHLSWGVGAAKDSGQLGTHSGSTLHRVSFPAEGSQMRVGCEAGEAGSQGALTPLQMATASRESDLG